MEYKWRVFSATSVAILMAGIDGTVVLLAFAPIVSDLHSDFVTIVWVVLAYLLVTTTFGLTLGRLGDLYGRKLMFNLGFVVFTIGSALCGFSQTGIELVLFRCLQGFGAALVTANAFAILSEAFPPQERGTAFGANAVIWSVGSVAGIVLGGLIITFFSWRVIFLVNIPIGIFGTYWAYRTIRPSAPRPAGAPSPYFDLPAAITFTAGVLALLLAVSAGIIYQNWTAPGVLAAFALTPILFAAFIVWELRYSKDPLFHREFFRNAVFTTSISTAFLQSLALFSANFLLLFYFEAIAGVSVLTASALVVPMAIASAIAGPFAGRWSDRIGPKYIAATGLILQASVILLLTRLTTTTPLLVVGVLEAAYGVGGGFFWPANTSTIMSSSPPGKFGVGSGIMNTFRNVGMVMSFAVALTAIIAVLPAGIAFSLFVGTTGHGLAPALAADYLKGQAFAFTISFALLLVALGLVLWKAPSRIGVIVVSRTGAPEASARASPAPTPGPSAPPRADSAETADRSVLTGHGK